MALLPASLTRPRAFPDRFADLLPVGLVVLYGCGVEWVAARLGAADRVSWTLYLAYAVPVMVALAATALAAHSIHAFARCPGIPLAAALRRALAERGLVGTTPLRIAALLLALPIFLSVFSSFKSLIPKLQPFGWDGPLAEADRFLHFGVDPWILLQPLLAQPLVVRAIDFLYHPAWSLLLFALWSWQATDLRRPALRLQCLIALPLTWILIGSVGGLIFSSAGPCYFAEVGGTPSDRFEPLMARLSDIHAVSPLVSQSAQRTLWILHEAGAAGFGSGISAMPSVHVASALLLFLVARRHGRTPGVLALAFVSAICVGSVALGWHYAIDAYAGAALAWLVWAGAGLVARAVLPPNRDHPPIDATFGGPQAPACV